jgi:hypothetical protein
MSGIPKNKRKPLLSDFQSVIYYFLLAASSKGSLPDAKAGKDFPQDVFC